MATLSLAMGAYAGLEDREIEAGQILVTTDTAQMYVDISDSTRLELNAKTAKQVANALAVKVNGAAFKTFNGSSAQTINIKAGNNVTLTASGNDIQIDAIDTTYDTRPNPYALTWGGKSYTGASAQTIDLADFGLTNVLHFLGTTTTVITDGDKTTTVIKINGEDVTPASGDIVMYNGSEFIWTGTTTGWEKIGDENLWIPNTRKIIAGPKLEVDGSDLSVDRTISHVQITTTAPTSTTGLFVKDITTDDYGHITKWENGDCSNLTLQIAGVTQETYDPFNAAATFNVPVMTAASSSAAGTTGLVPAPAKGATTRLLAADGSWKSIAAGNGIGVSGVSIYNKGVMEIAAGSTNGTISVTKGSTNTANATASTVTVYTLPVATSTTLGGTYGYTGLTLGTDGNVSLTKSNITSLLGAATKTNNGYLTSADFTTFSTAAAAIEWGTF